MTEMFYTVVHHDVIDTAVHNFRDYNNAKAFATKLAKDCNYDELKSDNYILFFSAGEGYVEVIQSRFCD